ncbi:MATE family efflux transporter [Acidobacteriota bacterium]
MPGTRPGSVTEAWRLAYPTIIGMISVTVMWTIDTIMLGQVGKVELAAAGFGGVLVWTLYSFFVGSLGSVNTFVAQSKGAGKLNECAVFAWQGIYLALGGTVILSLVLWKFDWILALARPDDAVIHECLRYGRIRMAGAFFLLSTFAVFHFLRGIGNVKIPMTIAIISNMINIVLDWFFIFGHGPFPRLTTFGAGLATSIADVSAFVMALAVFLGPRIASAFQSRCTFAFRPAAMLRLLRVGVPMGIQFFLDMGSFSVFMAIMGRLGTNELAASQIGLQVLSFSFMPANGIAKASTTLVGQYLGAGRPSLAEKCGQTILKMNFVYSLFVAAVFLIAQQRLYALFNRDPAVLAAGQSIIALLALFQILDAFQMTYSGILSGAGDTTFPMVVFAGSAWLLFIPLALILAYPAGLGILGGWTGGVIHLMVVAVILAWRFRRGAWKRTKI